MPNQTRRVTRILLIPSALLLVAACSGYGSGGGAAAASATTAVPTAAPSASSAGRGSDYDYGSGGAASPSAAASAVAGLQIGTGTGTAGTYLTGADGKTLYTFTKDSANTSACADTCAGNWPPLTVAAGVTPAATAGVAGALTTFARADGSRQVAYNGRPLYYFANDSSAGDANGQGIGGFWFIAQP